MAAAPLILAVASGVGTAMQVVGQVQQANAQNKAAQFQAQQADQAGRQAQASAQRAAAEHLRQSRIVQSNAIAAAGASGASVSDPTVSKVIGDIASEGEYRALTSIFEGDQQKANYSNQAAGLRFEGKSARQAGIMSAIGTGIQGASSLYSKYWPGGSTQSASGMGASPMAARTNFSNGSYINWG